MGKRVEPVEEIRKRILSLCEQVDCGIISPPINGQKAFEELCRFILGDNWYSINPISQEQINTEMLFESECALRKKVLQPRVRPCRSCGSKALVYAPLRIRLFKKNRKCYVEMWSVHCTNSCFIKYTEGDPRYVASSLGRTRQEAIDNWNAGETNGKR